jgi:hypothetical protein
MPKHPQPRRGLTFNSLLVLIVIAVVGIGLLAMKLYRDRELTQGRNYSLNNMKQLALAVLQYESQKREYPPLYFSGNPAWQANLNPALAENSYSWQVTLLPYLEQVALQNAIKKASNDYQLEPAKIQVPGSTAVPTQINLSVLQSPLASNPAPGTSNYVALAATRLPLLTEVTVNADMTQQWKHSPDGLLVPAANGQGRKHAQIADGGSRTLTLAESRETQRSNWCLGSQSFVVGFLPADSTAVPGTAAEFYPYFDKAAGDKWITKPGGKNSTALNQSPYHSSQDALAREWGPSSNDTGPDTIHALADGSVRTIADTIDPQIYFSLITIAGSEPDR